MNRYEKFLSRLLEGEKILIDGGTGAEVEKRGAPQLKNAWNGLVGVYAYSGDDTQMEWTFD